VRLAVLCALRLAWAFARPLGPFATPQILGVAVPAAFFVVALALTGIVQSHVVLANSVLARLADGLTVAFVPSTILVVAVVVTHAIANESITALRPAVTVVAILTVEVALEVEALLVAHAIVHERVEASRRRVANVAVAAV